MQRGKQLAVFFEPNKTIPMAETTIPVTLTGFYHKGQHCLGIFFDNYGSLNGPLRKAGAVWSATHKCWWVPLSKGWYEKVVAAFGDRVVISRQGLDDYLRRLAATTPEANQSPPAPGKIAITPVSKILPVQPTLPQQQTRQIKAVTKLPASNNAVAIAPVNAHVLPAMRQMLVLKGYSPSTQRTYLGEMSVFLQTLRGHAADEMTVQRLKDYLAYCHTQLKLSENTIHSRMNAMKFYYEQVLNREKLFWEIPRPKKEIQLPKLFNQDEITAIIHAAGNLKHKTMLMLAYSAGLRVSEVVALKTCNIDSKRMCIHIERAKGKKGRVATLSPVLLVMLREYIKSHKPDNAGYLFSGQNEGQGYSIRSLQQVLTDAKCKANIIKPGNIHALRHSFATHLLDKGTDVSMIMKLLGHNDIKTTLRYLHVTNRDILSVISPLDDLKL